MTRIGFLGAYSIDNTGDVIVGRATRQAVLERVACEEVVLAVDLPQPLWRHDWSAERGGGIEIRRVAPDARSIADDLDALVIGGGGIVLPDPGFEPFLAWGPVRAAWNAVCSQGTPRFDPTRVAFYAAVLAACERLSYVSVRNRTTERLLRTSGWDGPVAIVPDPSIGFACEPDRSIESILARRTSAPLVGLSVGNALLDPRASRFFDQLLGQLEALAARGAIELVVFPFGRLYGDVELARRAADRLPHARLLATPLSPEVTWQLVGKLDLYVCARLHAMLAAYAARVPFLVCDEYLVDTTATSKIRDFIVDRELEASYLSPWLGTRPDARVALALADLDKLRASASLLDADRAALTRHFDHLVDALALPRR